MSNLLKEVLYEESKVLRKQLEEWKQESIENKTCYTCKHSREVYTAYQNETGTGCELGRKKSHAYRVDKNCKYYMQGVENE